VIQELFFIESLLKKNSPFNFHMIINQLDQMKDKEFKEVAEKYTDLHMKDNKLDHQECGLINKGLVLLLQDL
jgi:hypothetical protein